MLSVLGGLIIVAVPVLGAQSRLRGFWHGPLMRHAAPV